MTQLEALEELLDGAARDLEQIRSQITRADATVARDIRLAADVLDHAASRMRAISHLATRGLLDECNQIARHP